MAENPNKDPSRSGLRSRLPKFLTEPIVLPGSASDMPLGATSPVATVPSIPVGSAKDNAGLASNDRDANDITGNAQKNAGPNDINQMTNAQPASDEETTAMLSAEEAQFQYLEYLVGEFQHMQGDLQKVYGLVEEISERESAQEKIFNTLHSELRDYKNDFIYEHLKPVIRPLLFLYDSLEQFDAEIALYERPINGERRQVGLSPQLVRENIAFFRDQLVESLRICEVSPMESPKGAFNPRMHKVIDVVPAEADQDGMIQRVVRSGWYLNGQLLRSAEVIVGKKMS